LQPFAVEDFIYLHQAFFIKSW